MTIISPNQFNTQSAALFSRQDGALAARQAASVAFAQNQAAPFSSSSVPGDRVEISAEARELAERQSQQPQSLAVASPADTPPPDPGTDNFSEIAPSTYLAVASPADTPPPDPGTDNILR